MELNISYLKKQLNIESSWLEDDEMLAQAITVAELSTQHYIDETVAISEHEDLKQAIIMLAAHIFLNKLTVSYLKPDEVPFSYKYLLSPYKKSIIN